MLEKLRKSLNWVVLLASGVLYFLWDKEKRSNEELRNERLRADLQRDINEARKQATASHDSYSDAKREYKRVSELHRDNNGM